MSFDARQFFAVAESLVSDARREDGLREARLRTAYGRLYYGLYLIVRDMLIRKHGVPAPRLGHGALSGFLQHSRLADDVRKIGRELERLYALRRVWTMSSTSTERPAVRWRTPTWQGVM